MSQEKEALPFGTPVKDRTRLLALFGLLDRVPVLKNFVRVGSLHVAEHTGVLVQTVLGQARFFLRSCELYGEDAYNLGLDTESGWVQVIFWPRHPMDTRILAERMGQKMYAI